MRDGAVENVVVWDGQTRWAPPAGTDLVRVRPATTGEPHIGRGWDGTRFAPPPPPPPPTPKQLAAAQQAARERAADLHLRAEAAAALAASESDPTLKAALVADQTRLRAEAAAALGEAR